MTEECAECRRLSDSYESATMAWFRIQGNLRIAECGRDEKSVEKLSIELNTVSGQREALRAVIDRHRSDHGVPLARAVALG